MSRSLEVHRVKKNFEFMFAGEFIAKKSIDDAIF